MKRISTKENRYENYNIQRKEVKDLMTDTKRNAGRI